MKWRRLTRATLFAWMQVLAVFTLINAARGLFEPHRDDNWLWIGWADAGGLGVSALLWLFALSTLTPRRLNHRNIPLITARVSAAILGIACVVDCVNYYRVLMAGVIQARVPIPLSALIATSLLAFAALGRPKPCGRLGALTLRGLACALWVALLIGSIASTDYGRHADVIVVFGAAVRADGTPSDALTDRTRHGIALYKAGRAPKLLMSGGRDPNARLSEPEAMREMALKAGVPPTAIELDESGVNTRATIAKVGATMDARGWHSALMVSHDYHLARVQLAARHMGVRSYTVPAHQPRPLLRGPYFFAREMAAFVWYWLR